MRGTIIHGPGDVRFEDRDDPTIVDPTDAVVRIVATCVCGSDLWPYRDDKPAKEPKPIGHEYVGIVEKIGDDVTSVQPGQFVVGGFLATCNECPTCRKGAQANCQDVRSYDGCQAELLRVPHADGTLIATDEHPADDLIPSLLTLSDVMCTGWHAAVCAGVEPGKSVVVVGDGAVGLCAVLAAKELGATTIIAMSRHEARQKLATEFGATHIVEERGDDGVAKVKELTDGIGADCVLECVGTEGAILQAMQCTRPGGQMSWVGLPHIEQLPQEHMFWKNVGIRGGIAPARAYIPELLEKVLARKINPGKVFDMELPLADVAEGYKAMDERRAIKVLLRP